MGELIAAKMEHHLPGKGADPVRTGWYNLQFIEATLAGTNGMALSGTGRAL